MTIQAPSPALEAAAHHAGLPPHRRRTGTDFAGTPTTRATVSLAADPSKSLMLELSEAFDAANPKFAIDLAVFFGEAAQRLRSPRPDCTLTLHGIPLSFGNFALALPRLHLRRRHLHRPRRGPPRRRNR